MKPVKIQDLNVGQRFYMFDFEDESYLCFVDHIYNKTRRCLAHVTYRYSDGSLSCALFDLVVYIPD